jgi:predicted esterase
VSSSVGSYPPAEHLLVNQEQRFYRAGVPLSHAKHLWICLHGYGQLAQYFKRKFSSVEDKVHLVFPEGVHRFYLDGNAGRVGASWMTKENRLTDIANQSLYLDALYAHIIGGFNVKVSVIGFSQGAAAASRWVFNTTCPIDNLILWSSAFPPDLEKVSSGGVNRNTSIIQLVGNEDPYLKGKTNEINAFFQVPNGHISSLITFEGGHEIRPKELKIVLDRILS